MSIDRRDQDPSIDWILSSRPAKFGSERDSSRHATKSQCDDPANRETAKRYSANQQQRRLSTSSEDSVPGIVGDAGASSPGTSCEGDDHNYHASGAAIWNSWRDSWGEEDSSTYLPFYNSERACSSLRTQRSNISLRNANLATSDLIKARSAGDLHRSYSTRPTHCITYSPEYAYCPHDFPSYPLLHFPTCDMGGARPLHDDTASSRLHAVYMSSRPIHRPPSRLRKCTTLEQCPENEVSRSDTSPPISPHSECHFQGTRPPLAPVFVEEKSVFEDWDDPKETFWNISRKRKRRRSSGGRRAGNGDNSNVKTKGAKLLNLSMLAMPGML
jgi:hypothetical protein